MWLSIIFFAFFSSRFCQSLPCGTIDFAEIGHASIVPKDRFFVNAPFDIIVVDFFKIINHSNRTLAVDVSTSQSFLKIHFEPEIFFLEPRSVQRVQVQVFPFYANASTIPNSTISIEWANMPFDATDQDLNDICLYKWLTNSKRQRQLPIIFNY